MVWALFSQVPNLAKSKPNLYHGGKASLAEGLCLHKLGTSESLHIAVKGPPGPIAHPYIQAQEPSPSAVPFPADNRRHVHTLGPEPG